MGHHIGTSIPYYQQVANVLRTRILGWEGDAPVRLPTEHALCETHHVSRITVRKALDVLQSEGLIQRSPGRGTLTVPSGVRVWRRLRRSRMIKLVTSFASNMDVPMSFYGQVHQGIFLQSEKSGYSLSTTQVAGAFPSIGPEDAPEDPERVVGVILTGVPDERVIAMHGNANYPVVCVDYWTTHPKVDSVVLDCFGEGQLAVEHLLDLGHREFFFLGNLHGRRGNRLHEADADLMLAGCRRALCKEGLSLPVRRVRFCRKSEPEVRAAVKWLIALRPRPTAGVVFSADTMLAVRDRLERCKVRCPDDLSLICKAYVGQPIDATTVRGDAFLMGQMAVDLLLERASGERQAAVRIAIPSSLQRGPTAKRYRQ
jgi:DNA-binding LacI/PurR family transcriptional regulator